MNFDFFKQMKPDLHSYTAQKNEMRVAIAISYLILAIILFYSLLYFFLDFKDISAFCGLIAVMLSVIVIPLLKRGISIGRFVLEMNMNALIFVTAIYCGRESRFEYFYLTLICLPFVIYRFDEKKQITLNCLHPVMSFYVLIDWGYDAFAPRIGPDLKLLIHIASPSLFFTIWVYLFYFAKIANHKQEQLSNLNHELMLSQESLREQSKKIAVAAQFSALGELAGGVAHEINNPLAIIKGFAYSLKNALGKGESIDFDRAVFCVNHIEETVTRISAIVSGLKSIARDGTTTETEVVDLQQVVKNVLNICADKMKGDGVLVTSEIFDKAISVKCRSVQVSQILLNLLSNAADAVKSNGGRNVWISYRKSSGFVDLRVIDDGVGISKDIADKIFNPFFSTKPVGKGSGLGLSISQKLAIENGGDLTYEQYEHNTMFCLRLPLHPPSFSKGYSASVC